MAVPGGPPTNSSRSSGSTQGGRELRPELSLLVVDERHGRILLFVVAVCREAHDIASPSPLMWKDLSSRDIGRRVTSLS